MARFVNRICAVVVRCIKFIFSANIEQYFLYNGIAYLVLGVISWIAAGEIRAFLCNIPAQYDYGGLGCTNCSDIVLMCRTPPCWRQAANLTIQKNALTPDNAFFKSRTEAALDNSCNNLIIAAESPSEMLKGIIAERGISGGASPSDACVSFHCKVLLNSLIRSENTDLPGTRDCTNTWDLKFDQTTSNVCTCSSELMSLELEEAFEFENLCGPMAAALSSQQMYRQILKKSKDPCYADNILHYYAQVFANDPAAAQRSFADRNCSYLTQKAFTVFEWFSLGSHQTQLYLSGMTPYSFNVPSTCKLDYCSIFNKTLYSDVCDWQTDLQLLGMTVSDINQLIAECPAFGYSVAGICAIVGTAPAACGGISTAPAPAMATTTQAGGASIRRLGEGTRSPGVPQPCMDHGHGRTTCKPDSAELMRGLQDGLPGGHDPAVPIPDHLESAPLPRLYRPPALSSKHQAALHSSRQLQASPTPSPSINNDDLEDWTTSAWSRCTCLQQCTDGMQYRSVTCPPEMVCKEPKPATSRPCTCGHCADCYVEDVIRGLAWIYWFQAISCLTLAVSFFSVAQMTEDDLTNMRWWTKLLGCYCKVLPLLVRITVYSILVLILYLVLVVIPGTGFMNDCGSSEALILLTICVSATFVLQLIAGIVVKKRRCMPAWLHNSVSPGWATWVMLPIRLIGP